MSKKIMSALLILAAVVLATGCSSGGGGGPTNGDLSATYIGGTVGLNAYLIEGMPPPNILDAGTYPFGIGVAIENMGEADVGPGTDNPFLLVRLEGINPEQFGVTDEFIRQQVDAPIRGSKRNLDGTVLPGEITNVNFEPMTYQSDIHGNTQVTVRVDLCYDYETKASASICLKDNVLENVQDTSICSLTGQKNPQNSGGPVQITSLTENPMSDTKVQVNFQIEHVGTGEFFGRTTAGAAGEEICDFSIRNLNKYYVDVEVEPLADSGIAITCARFNGNRMGRIKLYQGSPSIVSCTLERTRPNTGRVFQELLNIKLKYRYGQFIETPIVVQDVSI